MKHLTSDELNAKLNHAFTVRTRIMMNKTYSINEKRILCVEATMGVLLGTTKQEHHVNLVIQELLQEIKGKIYIQNMSKAIHRKDIDSIVSLNREI